MRSTPPVRLPADIYDAAVAQATADGRSVPEQIAHWARIGRELEAAPQVDHQAVAQVLAGDGSYDQLGERELALVRATWAERSEARRANLNLETEFIAAGEPYSESDAHGNLLIHPAGG